jgi:hypothetical protein
VKLRIARAISEKILWDVKKETGIHTTKLSLIENGHLIPTQDEKEKIAKALNVHPDEIDW